jgi:hypothetical protein
MRTFRFSPAIVLAAASLAVPATATAQRHARSSARERSAPAATAPAGASAQSGDYTLAVVSALLPTETPGTASAVVTLVIENRGTASAPVSVISVAPRNHLSLVSRSTIRQLAPGQRTTVELPVQNGPDGTECISITITPAPLADPGTAHFLASAVIPDWMPDLSLDSPDWADLTDPSAAQGFRNWTDFSPLGVFGRFGGFGAGEVL